MRIFSFLFALLIAISAHAENRTFSRNLIPGNATITGDLVLSTAGSRIGVNTLVSGVGLNITGNYATATARLTDNTNGSRLEVVSGSVTGLLYNDAATVSVGSSSNHAFNLKTNNLNRWTVSAAGNLTQDSTNGGIIAITRDGYGVYSGTADGADSLSIVLAGGGGNTSARGGYITTYGNENATPGGVLLKTGDAAGASIFADLANATSNFYIRNSSSNVMWTVDNNSGSLTGNASNSGNLVMARSTTSFINGIAAIPSNISSVTGTTPALLGVKNQSSNSDQLVLVGVGANANPVVMDFFKTRATDGQASTIVNASDDIGNLIFFGADGTAYRKSAAILARVDGTPGASDMPGSLIFQTTPDGSATLATVLTLSNDKSAQFTGTVRSSATADIGWTVKASGAATDCNTACTSACVAGQNATFGLVSCATAVTGFCICAGAS